MTNNLPETAKTDWYFPDSFLPNISDGVSHESVCVLNVGDTAAEVELVCFFEDDEPLRGFQVICAPRRTNHIRLDKIKNNKGIQIPQNRPYAIGVHSSQPILCQYTRVDATEPAHTLMTTVGL